MLSNLLLRGGADVNAKDKDEETPLHKVVKYREAKKEDIEIIKFLVSHGADIHAKGKGTVGLISSGRTWDNTPYNKAMYEAANARNASDKAKAMEVLAALGVR